MITYSGIRMRPGGNTAPSFMDIAVGMCRITRYAGAIWVPLAAHSILVGEYAYQKTKKYIDFAYGLLHDAHETVTGEVTRPWKTQQMKLHEWELDQLILGRMNMSVVGQLEREKLIKEMDLRALTAEATLLKLPQWAKYHEMVEGRPPRRLTRAQRKFAEHILFSSPWRDSRIVVGESFQMNCLRACFRHIAERQYAKARKLLMAFGEEE